MSSDADTAALLSGEKLAHLTQFVCPVSVDRNLPSRADHSLIVLSSDAETRLSPFSENSTERTHAECALSTLGVYRPTTEGVQRRIVQSLLPDAMEPPVGLYATVVTAS